MNLQTLALMCMLAPSFVCAATYYVSNSGDDNAAGTNENSPFKTIEHGARVIGNRDEIRLRRGDVFRESVTFADSFNTIRDYGDVGLPKPVVSGAVAVTGWSVYKGSIYQATVAQRVEMLYVDNTMMLIARYPNTGWAHIKNAQAGTAGTTLVRVLSGLSGNPRNRDNYWNGASMRWRRWSWWYETHPVIQYTASTSQMVVPGDIGGNVPNAGWGFYLDNKLEELDTAGEWYFDTTAMKVYLWAPEGKDPNTLAVEGSVRNQGVLATNSTVENICFRHQKAKGLHCSGSGIVRGCRFEGIGGESGGEALAVAGSGDKLVSRCVFRNNLNRAIGIYDAKAAGTSVVVEYDSLLNTGVVPGYGGQGSWHSCGIIIYSGHGVRVRYNYIDSVGYAAVLPGAPGNVVEYNIIKAAMSTLNDGGGVYTNCDSTVIRHNIILNTRGEMTSSGGFPNLSHGIWPEFLNDYKNSVIDSNTVVGSGAFGLFLPNNFACLIRGNVLFNNAHGQFDLSGITQGDQNHTITGNVLCGAASAQPSLRFQTGWDYGTFGGNYYCNPFTDSMIVWSGKARSVTGWQQEFPWADKSPKMNRIMRPVNATADDRTGIPRIVINDQATERSVTIGDNGIYQDMDGNTANGSVVLRPYSSMVLIHTGATGISPSSPATPRGTLCRVTAATANQVSFAVSLAKRTAVRLRIMDAAGRTVGMVAGSELGAGNHIITWQSPRCGQGVYLFIFKQITPDGMMEHQTTGTFAMVR